MFIDTNVLVRHLTGDPPDQAARASRLIADADALLLSDLIVAEIVYVLSSVYQASRAEIAGTLRAILAFDTIRVVDAELLQRVVEVYEFDRLDFPEAYLVASAERSGVGLIASFDRSIDRVGTVKRIEPG
jgi:predicted nucleic acid-binding protein